jgi:hypothetical protein
MTARSRAMCLPGRSGQRAVTRFAARTISRTPATTAVVTSHVAPKYSEQSPMALVWRRRKPAPRKKAWPSMAPKWRAGEVSLMTTTEASVKNPITSAYSLGMVRARRYR